MYRGREHDSVRDGVTGEFNGLQVVVWLCLRKNENDWVTRSVYVASYTTEHIQKHS